MRLCDGADFSPIEGQALLSKMQVKNRLAYLRCSQANWRFSIDCEKKVVAAAAQSLLFTTAPIS